MILDTSAVVAIFFKEPGFETLVAKMASAQAIGIGAPTLSEAGIVLCARMKTDSRPLLGRFLEDLDVQTIPFGDAHYRESVLAYQRFGRGRHPAGLNFGDCLTYAVARLAGQPLLFTGKDFSLTDIEPA